MSGTRFARSGRWRFVVCLGPLMLMFGMIAFFHSSQQQLSESIGQRIRCEKQQKDLNIQLESVIEAKQNLEKSIELNCKEFTEQQNLKEKQVQLEANSLGKVKHSLELLQIKHKEANVECAKAKMEHLKQIEILEREVQFLRENLKMEKILKANVSAVWKVKYEAILNDKEHLEALLKAGQLNTSAQKMSIESKLLSNNIGQNKSNVDANIQDTTNYTNEPNSPAQLNENDIKTIQDENCVNLQVRPNMTGVVDETLSTQPIGSIQVIAKPLATGGTPVSSDERNTGSIPPRSLKCNNSIAATPTGTVQIMPKTIGSLKKEISSKEDKKQFDRIEDNPPTLNDPLKADTELHNQTIQKSSAHENTDNAKLTLPFFQSSLRKLPENVAPVPGYFDDPIKSDQPSKTVNTLYDEDNRSNMVKERELNRRKFFLGSHHDDIDDDDVLSANAGHDMVPGELSHNINIKNEVIADRGKEFPDDLHVGDGNDEEEDEDDYSNPVARGDNAQAIRN